ncbi:MAG: hypothetical protein MI974_26215 [Chitinophagales bacterium]|nr:hypothetical protein [Chitinophagales bacterium]
MNDKDNIQMRIKELVSQDHIDEALELLFSRFNTYIPIKSTSRSIKNNYNSLVKISSRLRRLEKEHRDGMVDHQSASRIRSNIVHSLIDYIDDLPPSIIKLLEKSHKGHIQGEVKYVLGDESNNNKEELKDIESPIIETLFDKQPTSAHEQELTNSANIQNKEYIVNDDFDIKENNKYIKTRNLKSRRIYISIAFFAFLIISSLLLVSHNRKSRNIESLKISSEKKVNEYLSNFLFIEARMYIDSIEETHRSAKISNDIFHHLKIKIDSIKEVTKDRIGFLPIAHIKSSNNNYLNSSNIKNINFEEIKYTSDIKTNEILLTAVDRVPLYERIDTSNRMNKTNITKYLPENSSLRVLSEPFNVKHKDGSSPTIKWCYVELISKGNSIFDEETLNINTLPDSLVQNYLDSPSILLKMEYFPATDENVRSSSDTTGSYLYPYIVAKTTNRFFISVAAYNSFYFALMQREHLVNQNYISAKVVVKDNKFIVSVADFSTKTEADRYISQRKNDFESFHIFNH